MSVEASSQPADQAVDKASEHASLKVSLGAVPRRWGDVTAIVPPGQARHMITVTGLLGSVITGTTAAVLTLHTSTGLVAPAYAELALALVAALLVAICHFAGGRRDSTAEGPGGMAHQSQEITGPSRPRPTPGPRAPRSDRQRDSEQTRHKNRTS
jgi:hypothetical protein